MFSSVVGFVVAEDPGLAWLDIRDSTTGDISRFGQGEVSLTSPEYNLDLTWPRYALKHYTVHHLGGNLPDTITVMVGGRDYYRRYYRR
jgi:hypothetical protein